jgi:hypothetical protein
MSDLLASAAQLTQPPVPPPGLTELVGNRLTFQQIAAALGCSERSVYNVVGQLHIPYTRLLGKRLVDPADFRAALQRQQAKTPPLAAAVAPGRLPKRNPHTQRQQRAGADRLEGVGDTR